MNNRQHLNYRALVALLMLCSFVWLPTAGIALHFTHGASFQPTRHLLMTIHNLAAIIFLVSLLLHLRLNWKPLMKYLKITAETGKAFRRELGTAILIVTTILTLGILHAFTLAVR